MKLLYWQRFLLLIAVLLGAALLLDGLFVDSTYRLLHSGASIELGGVDDWKPEVVQPQKPLEHYERIMARGGLFRHVLQEEEPAAQRRLIDDYELLGISSSPRGRRALLRNIVTKRPTSFSKGQMIGDYTIEEILHDRVRLMNGDEEIVLQR